MKGLSEEMTKDTKAQSLVGAPPPGAEKVELRVKVGDDNILVGYDLRADKRTRSAKTAEG